MCAGVSEQVCSYEALAPATIQLEGLDQGLSNVKGPKQACNMKLWFFCRLMWPLSVGGQVARLQLLPSQSERPYQGMQIEQSCCCECTQTHVLHILCTS
jgi:hypothetical protein